MYARSTTAAHKNFCTAGAWWIWMVHVSAIILFICSGLNYPIACKARRQQKPRSELLAPSNPPERQPAHDTSVNRTAADLRTVCPPVPETKEPSPAHPRLRWRGQPWTQPVRKTARGAEHSTRDVVYDKTDPLPKLTQNQEAAGSLVRSQHVLGVSGVKRPSLLVRRKARNSQVGCAARGRSRGDLKAARSVYESERKCPGCYSKWLLFFKKWNNREHINRPACGTTVQLDIGRIHFPMYPMTSIASMLTLVNSEYSSIKQEHFT